MGRYYEKICLGALGPSEHFRGLWHRASDEPLLRAPLRWRPRDLVGTRLWHGGLHAPGPPGVASRGAAKDHGRTLIADVPAFGFFGLRKRVGLPLG
eukprot:CAMPEP_0117593380 /NCGR_PEP_ID=MMETSP0784-20121206/72601_1 /TAXON_ID=39447 /ORGANISM="" /LENGTH=95 /DNA_ID=CAMNT_0005395297 /DNA_START=9 /DNA_END=293 /DNA_ORIENTATION=-